MKDFKQLIYSITSLSTEEIYNLLNPTDHAKFFNKIDELCVKISNHPNIAELKAAAVEYLIEFERSQKQDLTSYPYSSPINTPVYPWTPINQPVYPCTPIYPPYELSKVYCYTSTNKNYD